MDECPFRILGLEKKFATEAGITARLQELLLEKHPVSTEMAMRLHAARRDAMAVLIAEKKHRKQSPKQVKARMDMLEHIEELKVHTRNALECGSIKQHGELHARLKTMGSQLASETGNSRMFDPFVSGYYNFVRDLKGRIGVTQSEERNAELEARNKDLSLKLDDALKQVEQLKQERDDAVREVERLRTESVQTENHGDCEETPKRKHARVFSDDADGKVFKQSVRNFIESHIVQASNSFVTVRELMDAFFAVGNDLPSEALFFKELRSQMPEIAVYKKTSGARGYSGISLALLP